MATKFISLDVCENYISEEGEPSDNRIKRERLTKLIRVIIAEELTARQRDMCSMYYYKHMTMPEIAEHFGVNKSTVSRTIARGLNRINQRVKYYKLR